MLCEDQPELGEVKEHRKQKESKGEKEGKEKKA